MIVAMIIAAGRAICVLALYRGSRPFQCARGRGLIHVSGRSSPKGAGASRQGSRALMVGKEMRLARAAPR